MLYSHGQVGTSMPLTHNPIQPNSSLSHPCPPSSHSLLPLHTLYSPFLSTHSTPSSTSHSPFHFLPLPLGQPSLQVHCETTSTAYTTHLRITPYITAATTKHRRAQ